MTTTTRPKTKARAQFVVYSGSFMGNIPAIGDFKYIGKGCAIPVDDYSRGKIETWLREGYFRPIDEDEFKALPYCSECGVRFCNEMAQARHLKEHANSKGRAAPQAFGSYYRDEKAHADGILARARARSNQLKATIENLKAGAVAATPAVIDPRARPELPPKDEDDEDEFGLE